MSHWRDDWYERLQSSVMDEPPLYCTKCSAPMRSVERRDGYTTRGVPVIVPGYTCPKNGGWRRLISLGVPFHDEVWAEPGIFDNTGYWRTPSYR